MDPFSNILPLNIPDLMRRHGLHAKKRLGQNFLVDIACLLKVVEAADIQPLDTVLEIGAGLGNLTRLLAAKAQHVVSIELDARLIPILREVLEPFTNIRLVEGDILNMDPARLVSDQFPAEGDYLVVANIPYYITSAVIRHLLEPAQRPERIILTLQKEVAERICAKPGDLSLLALSVQVFGRPVIQDLIPAGAFYPSPKVDSAILRVDLYAQSVIPVEQTDAFFRLAKAGFSQKRKTLRNALRGSLGFSAGFIETLLSSSEIDPFRRAETLDLEEWSRLTDRFLAMQESTS